MPNLNSSDLANVLSGVETTLGTQLGHYTGGSVTVVDAGHPADRTFLAIAHYHAESRFAVVRLHRAGNHVVADQLPTLGAALMAASALVDGATTAPDHRTDTAEPAPAA